VGNGAPGGSGNSDAPPELVAALKAWRTERARRDKVPPYVIMHDRNLEELATRRPSSLAELARCPGIGPAKLERYGDELLAVVDSAPR
jgi:superfamily II DNA helicase RecQ